MKQMRLRTAGTLERQRELYFNKQKAEHAKCFINDIYERWVQ